MRAKLMVMEIQLHDMVFNVLAGRKLSPDEEHVHDDLLEAYAKVRAAIQRLSEAATATVGKDCPPNCFLVAVCPQCRERGCGVAGAYPEERR